MSMTSGIHAWIVIGFDLRSGKITIAEGQCQSSVQLRRAGMIGIQRFGSTDGSRRSSTRSVSNLLTGGIRCIFSVVIDWGVVMVERRV